MKNSKSIDGTDIFVNIPQIFAAKISIVNNNKKLENYIDSIEKSASKLSDCWESETSIYYQKTILSKIKEIKIQQDAMNANLIKFFGNLMNLYESTEKKIESNAEMFK